VVGQFPFIIGPPGVTGSGFGRTSFFPDHKSRQRGQKNGHGIVFRFGEVWLISSFVFLLSLLGWSISFQNWTAWAKRIRIWPYLFFSNHKSQQSGQKNDHGIAVRFVEAWLISSFCVPFVTFVVRFYSLRF
jgi:hypothetical protein